MPNGIAFTSYQWSQILAAVGTMKSRAITHIRHDIKAKALFDAFVHEEDKEPLQRVFKICDVNSASQSFSFTTKIKNVEIEHLTVPTITATFAISIQNHAKFKFLLPKYMQKAQLQKDMPALEEAFRLIATIHFEWARVRQVLEALNYGCETMSAVKTICPHLAPLIKDTTENANVANLGDRLANMRDTEKVPALPLELRKHALYIGQTITKGLLIPKESEREADEFTIELTSASCDKAKWDGSNWLAF